MKQNSGLEYIQLRTGCSIKKLERTAHETQPVTYEVLFTKGVHNFVPYMSKSSPFDLSPFHLPIWKSINNIMINVRLTRLTAILDREVNDVLLKLMFCSKTLRLELVFLSRLPFKIL